MKLRQNKNISIFRINGFITEFESNVMWIEIDWASSKAIGDNILIELTKKYLINIGLENVLNTIESK